MEKWAEHEMPQLQMGGQAKNGRTTLNPCHTHTHMHTHTYTCLHSQSLEEREQH